MSNNYTKTILNFIKQKFDKFDRWAVQPDWSQNDTSSPDFIKNRVGGYEKESTMSIKIRASSEYIMPWSYGGAMIGLFKTDWPNATFPTRDEIATAFDISTNPQLSVDVTDMHVVDYNQDAYYLTNTKTDYFSDTSNPAGVTDVPKILVVVNQTRIWTALISPGIYLGFVTATAFYQPWVMSFSILQSKTEIVKIPEKYLGLPKQTAPDWDINDANSPGYIKNRPFYKYTESDVVARTITIAQHASSPVSYESLGLIEGEIVSIVLRTNSKPSGEIMTETVLSDAGTLYFSISVGGREVLRFKDTSVDIVMAQWLSVVGGAEVDLTFSRSSTVVKKIDPEYLPICESIKIHSQEDAKDYLLTVKNGTLTITEVTS